MIIISVMFYLSIRLGGYSVDSENSRGERKLTRTSRLLKYIYIYHLSTLSLIHVGTSLIKINYSNICLHKESNMAINQLSNEHFSINKISDHVFVQVFFS